MSYRGRITPYVRSCKDCGADFRPNHNVQLRCHPCGIGGAYGKARANAHSAVARAVRCGELTNLKQTEVKCADCDNRARCYDHRDYNKPLEVFAVCYPCNYQRGEAVFIAPVLRPDIFGISPRRTRKSP